MARQHTMTPARRAALRKAQLTSARKRRKKNTVRSTVKRAVRQRMQYTAVTFGTKLHRPKRRKKIKTRKKYTNDRSKWASNPELIPIKHWPKEDRDLYYGRR